MNLQSCPERCRRRGRYPPLSLPKRPPDRKSSAGATSACGSDLKVALARAFGGALGFPCRLAFEVCEFLLHLIQPLPEFVRFDPHAYLAVPAYEMGLDALLELAHQDRVLVTALRTGDVYRLVFEHP